MLQSKYRTHTCGQLGSADVDAIVKLSGWVHNKRDHGGVLFIDLRDHYGITQLVIDEQLCPLKAEDFAKISNGRLYAVGVNTDIIMALNKVMGSYYTFEE